MRDDRCAGVFATAHYDERLVPVLAGARRGEAPAQHSPAHLRRTERRGLLLRRRSHVELSAPGRRRSVRPDLHHSGGHARRQAGHAQAGQHRQGPHHVQLHFSLGRSHSVFLHPRRQSGVSAEARLLEGLRLADLRHLQDLHRQARWQRPQTADRRARLQRRVHHQPRWQADRLHFDAQRRSRHLHHERRRHPR